MEEHNSPILVTSTTEDIVIQVEPICYDKMRVTEEEKATTSKEAEESSDSDAPLSKYQVFRCPVCKKIKKDARDLKSHSRIHTRNHECPHCELRFFCKTSDLQRHLRVHHKDSPLVQNKHVQSHVCEICGNLFKEADNLRKHRMNVHEGIKQFTCRYCPARFFNGGKVKMHERRHTGEKPFKCTEPKCDKTFARKNTLKSHLCWHRGERHHACTACDRKFYTAFRLKNHLVSHTRERAFECDICFKKLARKRSIIEHKRKVHNIITPRIFGIQSNPADDSATQSDNSDVLDDPQVLDLRSNPADTADDVVSLKV